MPMIWPKWKLKFYGLIICINTCSLISKSDAQCSQDMNAVYRFGKGCGFLCHCLNSEQCDVDTGECATGCAFNWTGPACQHKNIAVEGYPRHLDNSVNNKYADRANDRSLSTCSYTAEETKTRTRNPWWRVWLPNTFTLKKMDILTIDSHRKYFNGFKVIVENVPEAKHANSNYYPDQSQICYTHSDTSLESIYMTVTCDHVYSGNQVRIELANKRTQLVLCDVRIYGDCAENVCGYDCNKLCYCRDITANDKVSGTCSNGCTGRWAGSNGTCDTECANDMWGETCDIQCGYCRFGAQCDVVTGNCPSRCEDGYKDTEQCKIECDDGNFGLECRSNCSGNCRNNAPCRKTDGLCPEGCGPGYSGEKCSNRCPKGFYGNDCSEVCSNNCYGGLSSCSNVDGICSKGCQNGYRGKLCNQGCDQTEWGMNCNKTCGKCKDGERCDLHNGSCRSGCIPGYKTTLMCNDECNDGKFGDDCLLHCSGNCKNNYLCRKTDGYCPDGCVRGYYGKECGQLCPIGYHGHDCKDKCSAHCAGGQEDCDRVFGTYLAGCKPGWAGRICQEETETEETSLTAVIAGVGAAIIVVIIIGVLAILWYLRRTRNGSNTDRHEYRDHRGMDMSNNRSEASGVKQTNNSSDTYDTLQCGNADEHHYELTELNHS